LGTDGVVIVRKGATYSTRGADMLCLGDELSATVAVKLKDPADVGVPVTEPSEESDTPGGKSPDVLAHESGGVPPVAARVCEYAMPAIPGGKEDGVEMASAGSTAIERLLCAVCCGVLLSATRTVKFAEPAALAVPVIVAPLSVSPVGSDPVMMDQL